MGFVRAATRQALFDQAAICLALELGQERTDAGDIALSQSWSRWIDKRHHLALIPIQEVDLARHFEAGGGGDENWEVDRGLGFVEGHSSAKRQWHADRRWFWGRDLLDPTNAHTWEAEAIGNCVPSGGEEREAAGDEN
jgi:hypothetical protein